MIWYTLDPHEKQDRKTGFPFLPMIYIPQKPHQKNWTGSNSNLPGGRVYSKKARLPNDWTQELYGITLNRYSDAGNALRVISFYRRSEKAVSHRDLYAPKRFFSRNTAPKSHGRRQPCRGFLPCLAKKSITLECFAVLKLRFFLTNNLRGRRNTGCISRTMDSLWGKRFLQNRVNPYVSPPKRALLYFAWLSVQCG